MKQPNMLKEIKYISTNTTAKDEFYKLTIKNLAENKNYLYHLEGATQSSQAPRKKITLQNLERFSDLEETNIIRSDT